MEKFNQTEYNKQYRKKHKVQLNIDLNPDEKEELIDLIQKNGFKSNREFLLECIKLMKSENNPFTMMTEEKLEK